MIYNIQSLHKSRTRIKPEPQKTTAQIPLSSSTVSAGFPSPADDFAEQSIDLNKRLIKHPTATFLVKVSGNSMQNAGINEGDLLVVDRAEEPSNNSIVVAILEGEFTVKRIKRNNQDIYLQPENPAFKPIRIRSTMNFEVWGVVTHVIHST